jgi:superfamily II DNA or RNA helicase
VYTKTVLPETIERKIQLRDGSIETFQSSIDGNRDYMTIMDVLSRDEARSRLIVAEVMELLKENKHNSVLVVTHRRRHARMLKKIIRAFYGRPVALLIGSRNEKIVADLTLKIRERKIRCAVATLSFVKTGTSLPPLNRLVITTPIGGEQDLEQLIGRIRRKCEGKTDAKIVHIVDEKIPLCWRHYHKKAVPFYTKLGIKKFGFIA